MRVKAGLLKIVFVLISFFFSVGARAISYGSAFGVTTRRNIELGDKKFGPEDQSHGKMYIAHNLTGRFESGMPFHKPNFPLSFLSST